MVHLFPFELNLYKSLKQETAKTYNEILNNYFSKVSIVQQKTKYQKQIEKIHDIIKKQQEDIKKLEKQELENKKKAELLYENYKFVSEILDQLKKASKKYNWKEIKERLKGHKTIKEVTPSEKSIVLELK